MPHFLCPNVLADGSCSTPDCRYPHDALSCDACLMVFGTSTLLDAHLASRRHLARVEDQRKFPAFCSMCLGIEVSSEQVWRSHLRGKGHTKQAKRLNQHPTTAELVPKAPSPEAFCDICQVLVGRDTRMRASHNASNRHLRCIAFRRYNTARASAESDKNGVELHGEGDLGIVDPAIAREGVHITLTIQALSLNATTILHDYKLVSAQNRRKTAYVLYSMPSNIGFDTLSLDLLSILMGRTAIQTPFKTSTSPLAFNNSTSGVSKIGSSSTLKTRNSSKDF